MEMLSSFIQNIKDNIVKYSIYCGLIILIIIIVLITIKFLKRKSKFYKSLRELENRRDNLINPEIKNKLDRINKIGQNNTSFLELYNQNFYEYTKLVNESKIYFDEKIEDLKNLFVEKNYRLINETIKNLDIDIQAFIDRNDILNANLTLVCKEEDELLERNRIFTSTVTLVKNELNNDHPEIKYLSSQFEKLFENINKFYESFNEYMIRGNFFDAKELISEIEVKIEYIKNNLEHIFTYSRELTFGIPNSINELIEKYNTLKEKNISLTQIPVVRTINDCKERWLALINKMKDFKFDTIGEEIIGIHSLLNKVENMVDVEVESKNEYEKDSENIYNRAIELDARYIKSMTTDASYKRRFEANSERINLDKQLKLENQKLVLLKSALDALNYSKQPYSSRLEKLHELKQQCDVFDSWLNKSFDNYTAFENVSAEANSILTSSSSVLRDLEINLRNSKFDKLSNKYEEDFKVSFNLINRLNQVLHSEPIDTNRVNELANEIKRKVSELQYSVTADIDYATQSENLLMKGNLLRPTINSLDNDLTRCELLFEDGRYEDCLQALHIALADYENEGEGK